ncbi:CIC11C00000002188 [Sungouiella intermedia]|uniref:CIC11C00000002188 n=1 Tax=Sungouiella intermedia TaxID=45354 RepID=A0A1L0BNV1_9ASCO|nr:CIC11C00000002188 [[Candida] intermedia]
MPPPLLRKRLTSAKRALGILQNNVARELRSETLLNYQDKLLPVLSNTYYDLLRELQSHEGESVALPRSTLALKHTLHVPIITVTNLTVQPGEDHFIIWLLISSFLPLVAACMAPLGNLISLVGLVEHWRISIETGKAVLDIGYVFSLNIASFVLGIVGNMSLVMNFSGKMRYLVTQSVSIICWILAATFLLIAVLLTNREFSGPNATFERSEGFWLAVFTTVMYYSCSVILMVNFIGYKLDKYPPTFNLDKKQRLLMSYTIAFSVWQAVGSIAMTHLISNLSYGTSLYYCTVSMLTIGLGDIVPITAGAKVFALIFSFIGVIIMGLIVATIRQVVLSSAGPSIFWHFVEKNRIRVLKTLEEKNVHLTTEESFRQMRLLRAKVRLHQTNVSLVISITVFLSFWLIGALIFHFEEKWGFFNSVYFCFLCLVTIGYGDFHPSTAFGRIFFIQWAITAIPLMTILISNVGDKLYEFADRVDTIATFLLSWRTWVAAFTCWPLETSDAEVERKIDQEDLEENIEVEEVEEETALDEDVDVETSLEEEGIDAVLEGADTEVGKAKVITDQFQSDSSGITNLPNGTNINDVQRIILERLQISSRILDRLNTLRVVMLDGLEDPQKRYTVEEWTELLLKLQHEDNDQTLDPKYWLGDSSPLRLPIKEPNYLLLKLFFRIEEDLQQLIESQNQALRRLYPTDPHIENDIGVAFTPPRKVRSQSSLT